MSLAGGELRCRLPVRLELGVAFITKKVMIHTVVEGQPGSPQHDCLSDQEVKKLDLLNSR